jgi:hypothetical protein
MRLAVDDPCPGKLDATLESLRAPLRNHRLVRRRPDHCRGNVRHTLTADPRSEFPGTSSQLGPSAPGRTSRRCGAACRPWVAAGAGHSAIHAIAAGPVSRNWRRLIRSPRQRRPAPQGVRQCLGQRRSPHYRRDVHEHGSEARKSRQRSRSRARQLV